MLLNSSSLARPENNIKINSVLISAVNTQSNIFCVFLQVSVICSLWKGLCIKYLLNWLWYVYTCVYVYNIHIHIYNIYNVQYTHIQHPYLFCTHIYTIYLSSYLCLYGFYVIPISLWSKSDPHFTSCSYHYLARE